MVALSWFGYLWSFSGFLWYVFFIMIWHQALTLHSGKINMEPKVMEVWFRWFSFSKSWNFVFFQFVKCEFSRVQLSHQKPHGDEPTNLPSTAAPYPPHPPIWQFWDRGSTACPSARVVKVLKLSKKRFLIFLAGQRFLVVKKRIWFNKDFLEKLSLQDFFNSFHIFSNSQLINFRSSKWSTKRLFLHVS